MKRDRTALLTAATVALVGLLLVFGLGTASGEDEGEVSAAAAPEVVSEVVEKRTANSRTLTLSNGELETRIYQTAVNYRDENGNWKPIVQELHETSDGTVTNGANGFDVSLPEDLDQAPATVSVGDAWVSEMPIGLGIAPADVTQGDASYEAAGGVAEFEFFGLANGIKQNIVLADPSAPTTYRFRLDASSGLTPTLVDDGSIAFADGEENVALVMPAPVMFDSANAPAPDGAVAYDLAPSDDNGGWVLAVEADPEWLANPARVWPVTIDPTTLVPSPELDCVVANGFESQMCGTTGYSHLDTKANYLSSGADQFSHVLLRFNLSSIPKDASLTSASIGLNAGVAAKNTTGVDLYRANNGWVASATWIYRNPPFKWADPGGDVDSPAVSSVTTASRGGSQSGPWTFSGSALTWMVQQWLDGLKANEGVLLKLADEKSRSCCIERRAEFESSTAAVGKKPYLSVQYMRAATADKKVSSPTDGTTTAKRFRLTSAWEQSGVEGVTFQYKGPTGWINIPEGQVIDSEDNKAVKWPLLVNSPSDRQSRPLYWDASNLTGSNPTAKGADPRCFQRHRRRKHLFQAGGRRDRQGLRWAKRCLQRDRSRKRRFIDRQFHHLSNRPLDPGDQGCS